MPTAAALTAAIDDRGAPLDQILHSRWLAALSGDLHGRAQWFTDMASLWKWQHDGLAATGGNAEWAAAEWLSWGESTLPELGNVLIEVTVSGRASAAGLSFGDYKDFLVPLESQAASRRLQLEIDLDAGRWAFRVDGQLQERHWWDSQVRSVQDLVSGRLTLKVQHAERVVFQELKIHKFEASCHLSIIMTCHRFLQRMRLSLRNWCEQTLPFGLYEILVVNPASPDGTHEHLAAVAASYPHVRVRELAVGADLVKNKGAMINRAVRASRGKWIWLTDADCLFVRDAAKTALAYIQHKRQYLFFSELRYLSAGQTDAMLAGRLDALRDFDGLTEAATQRGPDNAPWGYTQIVHRSTIERLAYREHFNHSVHSDNVFTDDCKRRGITPHQVPGLLCLHLDHPFAWYGTDAFL